MLHNEYINCVRILRQDLVQNYTDINLHCQLKKKGDSQNDSDIV